jgi:hypothetical protein
MGVEITREITMVMTAVNEIEVEEESNNNVMTMHMMITVMKLILVTWRQKQRSRFSTTCAEPSSAKEVKEFVKYAKDQVLTSKPLEVRRVAKNRVLLPSEELSVKLLSLNK